MWCGSKGWIWIICCTFYSKFQAYTSINVLKKNCIRIIIFWLELCVDRKSRALSLYLCVSLSLFHVKYAYKRGWRDLSIAFNYNKHSIQQREREPTIFSQSSKLDVYYYLTPRKQKNYFIIIVDRIGLWYVNNHIFSLVCVLCDFRSERAGSFFLPSDFLSERKREIEKRCWIHHCVVVVQSSQKWKVINFNLWIDTFLSPNTRTKSIRSRFHG